ncbi:UDP-2,3-diacylglucosamine diphosphatase [Sediminibacterium sp. TEGAF015]|uniref:UDP-2,3-diacylglucosamine diphosphatase n=1 Tax=Sediminibacterium sp. TEGAF015 TaxID=575378 RepID=UPI0022024A7E|nr:UDP-2,3-diacylglucosamine diphosphatase [Sediminibacterium sp. TEGAF015]BDQ12783.1 UDP-2,3-diacylglucosamine hydrolase [Sediminibacterium sp. TEGAF015]
MEKRSVNVVVMSDLHLGTYGCHATEILQYLKSINPTILILNGDIIDGWQFSKRYFPTSHLQVIKEIINLVSNGTRVIYITGNHDEMLRRYSDVEMGNFKLTDKVVMEIDGKMTWIFHGDVFDATTKGSAKMLAKLGGHGYDLLILLNRFINYFLRLAGKEKMSLSKKVKASVKQAVSWIGNFEQTAAELAISKKYDYVICGHIHQPQVRTVETQEGKVVYMNSGDWVENLTALEYNQHEWTVYHYDPKTFAAANQELTNKKTTAPTLNVITDEVSLFLNSLILQP